MPLCTTVADRIRVLLQVDDVASAEQDYAKDNELTVARVAIDAGLTITGFARFKVGA